MRAETGFAFLAQYLDRSDDNYEVARQALGDLRVNAKATATLLPVIAWAVGTQRRSEDRTVQRASRGGSKRRELGSHDVIAERKRMLDVVMKFGDGRPGVRVGAASVGQHREYVAMLGRNVDGLRSTIAEHERHIAAIEAAGVSCLDELYALEGAA